MKIPEVNSYADEIAKTFEQLWSAYNVCIQKSRDDSLTDTQRTTMLAQAMSLLHSIKELDRLRYILADHFPPKQTRPSLKIVKDDDRE